jgi:phenylacetate-CoA ligase
VFAREVAYVGLSYARQYGTGRGLRRQQLRGLNRMLAHCRGRVPYYRDDPRYAVGPLRSPAELAALPLLTKQQLRERREAFVAAGVDPAACLEFSTSGTTGERLRVLHDRDSHDYHFAACVRRFLATGRYLPTHRLSHLRHFEPPRRGFQRGGLFRRHVILSSRPMPEIVAELLAARPQVIIGYPVHLRELLHALSAEQLGRLRRTLRFVMTESELLVDRQRQALVDALGVPVFDEYSSWETLNIYYECRYGGRHVAEDRVWVEIVDAGGRPVPDGVEGGVVVTAFGERAMPLLRYVLGDLGVIEVGRCRCRRRFRTMRLTRGRVNDAVVLPSGARLFSDTFLELAERHPGLAGCFVRQAADGTVALHAVPDGTVPVPVVLATLADRLREIAGEPFPLAVLAADRVPITPGGKGRFVEVAEPPAPPPARPAPLAGLVPPAGAPDPAG